MNVPLIDTSLLDNHPNIISKDHASTMTLILIFYSCCNQNQMQKNLPYVPYNLFLCGIRLMILNSKIWILKIWLLKIHNIFTAVYFVSFGSNKFISVENSIFNRLVICMPRNQNRILQCAWEVYLLPTVNIASRIFVPMKSWTLKCVSIEDNVATPFKLT